jgi:hypothetical protein
VRAVVSGGRSVPLGVRHAEHGRGGCRSPGAGQRCIHIGGAVSYAFYGDAKIRSSALGGLDGSYTRNNLFFVLFFFALNVNWAGLWGSGG